MISITRLHLTSRKHVTIIKTITKNTTLSEEKPKNAANEQLLNYSLDLQTKTDPINLLFAT